MNQVNCPVCSRKCVKHGKTNSGTQRWYCKQCQFAFTQKINKEAKELQTFLNWLFGKTSQKDMPGEGKTAQFWNIWPMPPVTEDAKDVLYVDGIYLGRKVCVLICCDDDYVLGWYLCRSEHSGAWEA